MTQKPAMSLSEFVREERKKDCPVCQLPAETRDQMRSATDKGIKRPVVLKWLSTVVGARISDHDLTSHYSGKHDV